MMSALAYQVTALVGLVSGEKDLTHWQIRWVV